MIFNTNVFNFRIKRVSNLLPWTLSLLLSLPIFTLSVFTIPVFAGEKINQSLSTDNTLKIKICNDRGSIKVHTWDKLEVLVKGEIDDLADNFIFDKKGDLILLEVELTAKHAHGKNNGKGSKLEIWLPQNLDLQFNGIATDLSITGLDGDVDITSVSGAVNASSISGELRVKNISGKTVLNDISGKIDISLVSGNLAANVMSGDIKVKAISSDISVVTNQIENVNLFSISGITKLSGKLDDDGKINLENISGESFFYFADSIDAEISIETGPDGEIVNRIKPFERKESHLNSQQQYFVEGAGNARITMNTVSGKVGLKDIEEMNRRKKR
ncbi:MAG: hypothetical protein COB38_01475 [Gammaproteobacteria bacterium]|nr:MAG: hypothetical protein COB38_01475 [Gammaproteobacteria bacterium]